MNQFLIAIVRSTPSDELFRRLVRELDADLRTRYGKDQDKYDAFNIIDTQARVALAMEGQTPIGCGCWREMEHEVVEMKRMYVQPAFRGKGIAKLILNELEAWASEEGYKLARLETAIRQPEAIALYTKQNYQRIPNYGPYKNMPESICMEKALIA